MRTFKFDIVLEDYNLVMILIKLMEKILYGLAFGNLFFFCLNKA